MLGMARFTSVSALATSGIDTIMYLAIEYEDIIFAIDIIEGIG
jgi:hypothetical protein